MTKSYMSSLEFRKTIKDSIKEKVTELDIELKSD